MHQMRSGFVPHLRMLHSTNLLPFWDLVLASLGSLERIP